MANWKHYISNGYAGCKLLAYAHDHCRDRDVRIYLIPGQYEAVGISDGVDSWIAPVAPDLFSVDVQKLIKALQAGEDIPKPVPPAARIKRVKLDEAPSLPIRRIPVERISRVILA